MGNLVAYADNPNIIQNLPRGLKGYSIDFYWNGSSRAGMKVSPGIYHVAVYLKYTSGEYKKSKITKLVGIGN